MRNRARKKKLRYHILSIFAHRIGFNIARRLAQDGARVIISSRKQQNADQAVDTLQREGLSVVGTVCHVGKAEDQERLVTMVRGIERLTVRDTGILLF